MTDKENLKDTLSWMQRKLVAADRSLTNAQYNGDYPAAENLRKNMRRWRTAIKAVKEKIKPVRIDREKWGMCKHCLPNSKLPCQGEPHEFVLSDAVLFYSDSDFGWEGQKVDFCPWCGRPLTEEGWKMLEIRIGGNKQCTQE